MINQSSIKRVCEVYSNSYALHVFIASILLMVILQGFLPQDSDILADIVLSLEGVATLLFIQKLPYLFGDIEIPRWYTIIVSCYMAILTSYFISGFPSYFEFSFYIYLIVIIPVPYLIMLVLWLDDDFEFEDE